VIWIGGPWWDACWILSGLPIGIVATVLVLSGVPYFGLLAFGVIVFQTAHTISPICLAWSHVAFRQIMLARPMKFMVVPLAILVIWTIAGYVGGLFWPQPIFNPVTLKIAITTYWQPLGLMGTIYGIWNIYHFGKQNFGVMSIYRRKYEQHAMNSQPRYSGSSRLACFLSQRRFDLIFCCTTAWAVMAVPYVHMTANYLRIEALQFYNVLAAYIAVAGIFAAVMLWREWQASRFCLGRIVLILANATAMASAMLWGLGGLGIISMNHWLVAIGLAGRASRRTVDFPIAIIVIGAVLFWALFVRGWAIPTQVAAAAVAFRLALGIVHFLYDRWIWKFTDPQVRATIGCDLFHRPADQQNRQHIS
jgi:hypothetical protein